MLTGQNVLLTSGGSPIGQGLVPRILEQDPAVLRLFDSTESNLEAIMNRFDDGRLRHLLVRGLDVGRLEYASKINKPELTDSFRHALPVSLHLSGGPDKR
jgi:FlaA1/EpsC-like NDP-sugar epimerase